MSIVRSATDLRRALIAHWQLKLALSAALTIFFCVPYFLLQRLTIVPVRHLPSSVIDRAIPFQPAWVWMYQSEYLLLSVVPWLSGSTDHLMRYARGFVLQASVAFICFLLLPIEAPRPVDVSSNAMFQLLVSYDRPLNCLPSLHVGLSVYTVLFAARALRTRPVPMALASLWVAAIAYSALASKQHYAIDLPAGALLAWACHAWAWNHLERSEHAEAIPDRPAAGLLRLFGRGHIPLSADTGAGGQSTGGSRPRIASTSESRLRAGDS